MYKFLSIICLLLSFSCNHLFYQGDNTVYSTPNKFGISYKKISLQTGDGELLQAWKLYNPQIDPKGTIVHFHGNAQNRTAHYHFVSWLVNYGYNVIVFDYRGYHDSSGSSSRYGLIKDGLAVVDFTCNNSVKPVFIIAQSLGGAIAIPALATLKKHCV